MTREPYLSVIIPAYNEAQRLPKTLRRIHEYLSGSPFQYEILLVLDGPSDNTLAVVQSLEPHIRHLKIINREVNRGKGYTVAEGMLAASGLLRLFCDADNSTDIAHFEMMMPLFEAGCDVVIASRNAMDAGQAGQAVPQVWYKRAMGHLGNLVVQLLAVPGIWDTQCGFKAFRAEAAKRIFSRTMVEGWGFDIEVLALARVARYKIGIIPARWVNDERSHFRGKDYLKVLADVVNVRKNLLLGKYRL